MSITLEHVAYVYMPGTPFEHQALCDVSAVIEEGSLTAIAGHTGSGKSTLLQQLNGLLQPTAGRVLVDDVDINPKAKKERAAARTMRLKVGMVFQYAEQQLFEETIEKDIAFGPKSIGLSEAEMTERVKEAMKLVHLDYETYRKRSPLALSGGQMRRVAIAGVLALRPKYLVLDEPVVGHDPRGREELVATIRHLHEREHVTIVLVSHNMDDIARLADHVLILNKGRLVCDASPRKAFAQENLLEGAGLKLPHVMALMKELRAKGLPVRMDCLTIEEAKREILNVLKAVKGKGGKKHVQ